MTQRRSIHRRQVLAGGGALAWTLADSFLLAHATAAPTAGRASHGPFTLDSAAHGAQSRRMHGGRGTIDVKFFFEPGRPMKPALFLQYDIPPGAGEGVHTHAQGHPNGPWEEYYYIVSGSGRMLIDGQPVPVKPGDNVHTPLGVAHGIENTGGADPLRVFLVAISRE